MLTIWFFLYSANVAFKSRISVASFAFCAKSLALTSSLSASLLRRFLFASFVASNFALFDVLTGFLELPSPVVLSNSNVCVMRSFSSLCLYMVAIPTSAILANSALLIGLPDRFTFLIAFSIFSTLLEFSLHFYLIPYY